MIQARARRRLGIGCLAVCTALAAVAVAEQGQTGVGVAVEVVQVDAVVTDGHGRAVNDLAREDFEILEDGLSRPIANFAYVRTEGPPRDAMPVHGPEALPAPAPAGAVGRTVALVVDDLGLSPSEVSAARDALKKLVHGEIRSADRVCLASTGAFVIPLAFTSDPAALLGAIEALRWNPRSDRFREVPQIGIGFAEGRTGQRRPAGSEPDQPEQTASRSMSAVRSIVKDLERQPGRKALVLFSNGLRVVSVTHEESRVSRREEGKGGVESALQTLVDSANRASVVVYTLDMRGLQTLTMEADDYVTVPGFIPIQDSEQSLRRHEFTMAQEGLQELANETGGLFFGGSDPAVGLRRALVDQQGYYLLGYLLDPATVAPEHRGRAYHDIEVKVRRPKLHVRARSRFYRAGS
jgi:VWFA-related protein